MSDEVLCLVVEVAIGVSHDGLRDPKRNGKLGYMSGDVVLERLASHGRETKEQIAGHQGNRSKFPKL